MVQDPEYSPEAFISLVRLRGLEEAFKTYPLRVLGFLMWSDFPSPSYSIRSHTTMTYAQAMQLNFPVPNPQYFWHPQGENHIALFESDVGHLGLIELTGLASIFPEVRDA